MTDEQKDALEQAISFMCANGFYSAEHNLRALLANSGKGGPVAWRYRLSDNLWGYETFFSNIAGAEPLYLAAPQASEALSEEKPWYEHRAADGTTYWLHTPPANLSAENRGESTKPCNCGVCAECNWSRSHMYDEPDNEAENRGEQAECATSTLGRTVADAQAYVDTWDNQRRNQAGLPPIAPRTDVEKDAALTDALRGVLFALTERQCGNVIRSEDEYVDAARAILAAQKEPK